MSGVEGGGNRAEILGLVPAAGLGTRVASLPCSKEIFPVALGPRSGGAGLRVRVACDDVLEAMRLAGVDRVYMVLRDGKWDIPAYLGDGRGRGVHLAYLMMGAPWGVPFTLDQAYPFVRGRRVVCGFPDILLRPTDVFTPLLDAMDASGSDAVLALFPAGDPELVDMVEVDGEGRIRRIQVKPGPERLTHTWGAAAWGPAFTELLHRFAREDASSREGSGPGPEERHLGDVIQVALDEGLSVDGVPFPGGGYVDVGVPENLLDAFEIGEGA